MHKQYLHFVVVNNCRYTFTLIRNYATKACCHDSGLPNDLFGFLICRYVNSCHYFILLF